MHPCSGHVFLTQSLLTLLETAYALQTLGGGPSINPSRYPKLSPTEGILDFISLYIVKFVCLLLDKTHYMDKPR